ncbi:hypothetical protein QWY99_08635 [Flavobacterium branchiarum]|uniref:Uncharacterized protein n=1 Tax=Flavobacterium branchiarum TaxID=1114870 RepID=A0ABV5FR11_9FLAO|nr:hypothetical protein [Flavobacterium branchiarum]MDN3673112.1 hypothetical protein [Flavobacterium branchiarum]
MDKRTKKRATYNGDIIDRLIKKFGVSKRYVQMSLSGDRESETSETIKKTYDMMRKEVIKFLDTL